MTEREYIKTGKVIFLPDSSFEKRKLDDQIWKSQVFFHLLNFYKTCNLSEIQKIIAIERSKKQSQIEDEIAKFIRMSLSKNRTIGLHGFIIKGGVNNDEIKKGLYDISFFHSDWKDIAGKDIEFHFECKNLDGSKDLTDKYVNYNTYKKNLDGENVFDGGVIRYFNGKYAQKMNFGGMIGFVLGGEVINIKNEIVKRLYNKFHTSPEGDLLKVLDNSIEENDFTFDSCHKRFGSEFMLHHLLLNLT